MKNHWYARMMSDVRALARNRQVPALLSSAVGVAISVGVLSGCAADPANQRVASTPSASSCAVPAQPGVEPPAGCAVYDSDAGMESNELYRKRMTISVEAQTAGEELVQPVNASLERLRSTGSPITEEAVRSALVEAGLTPDGVQVRDNNGSVLFGALYSVATESIASCVYGTVSIESVTVDVGGLIMDGGCLTFQ